MTDTPRADDELSPEDRALLSHVAAAIGDDPMPERLLDVVDGLLAWIDVDSDLATLAEEQLDEPVGVRGGAPSTGRLVFTAGDGLVVEVAAGGGELSGQVMPPGATRVRIERARAGGAHEESSVDELGRFSMVTAAVGPVRLRFDGGARSVVTGWFVV